MLESWTWNIFESHLNLHHSLPISIILIKRDGRQEKLNEIVQAHSLGGIPMKLVLIPITESMGHNARIQC